jgi:hypothetical protein
MHYAISGCPLAKKEMEKTSQGTKLSFVPTIKRRKKKRRSRFNSNKRKGSNPQVATLKVDPPVSDDTNHQSSR